jgi:hypothetical protein
MAGVLLVPASASEIVIDYVRTFVLVLVMGGLLALAAPPLAFPILFLALLFVRSGELFGTIQALSLFVLGHGLIQTPSYTFAALTLLAMVLACHFRAAREISPRAVSAAVLVVGASLAAGGLAALLSTARLTRGETAFSSSPTGAEPSTVPLIAALLLLPVLGYVLVRYLNLRASLAGKKAGAEGTIGEVVGEGDLEEAPIRLFAGPPTNEVIVRGYIRWRRKLADRGYLFRRDRTAEESARYLGSRLPRVPSGVLDRITELFTEARYSGAALPEECTAEFRTLTRSVLDQLPSSS